MIEVSVVEELLEAVREWWNVRRSRRRPMTFWRWCSSRSHPHRRSGELFGRRLAPCWRPSISSRTLQFQSWNSPLRLWWIPKSTCASGRCVMNASPSHLKNFVVSRMSTPSWSPILQRTPLWKWRWHGDATLSSGGGLRFRPHKLAHSTRSWAILMMQSVLLVWIQRDLWAHPSCLLLPLARIRPISLPWWWSTRTSHVPGAEQALVLGQDGMRFGPLISDALGDY